MKLKINNMRRLIFYFVIIGFTYWVVSEMFHSLKLHELIEHVPLNRELSTFLTKRVVQVEPSPYSSWEASQELESVIYVLGGSPKSLRYRFRTAAGLHLKGIGNRIMILHKDGITEYDPSIGRNLTNNEWAIRELINLGVRKKDIEFISVKRGLGGTLREAKAVSNLVLSRKHQCLILVSSSYHTKRVWETFSRLLANQNLILKIYSSNDDIKLWGLFLEYFKLISYKYILVPIYLKLLI